jgi:hypothetical protein
MAASPGEGGFPADPTAPSIARTRGGSDASTLNGRANPPLERKMHNANANDYGGGDARGRMATLDRLSPGIARRG